MFQGDPRITIDEDGASLKFIGGQPVMDQGLENQALIALFTKPGWAGNILFSNEVQQVGSEFEIAASQAITLTSLNNIRDAALKALEAEIFGQVEVDVVNPESTRLEITILLRPPGQDVKTLILTRNGLNWIAQSDNPAYRRL